MTNNFSNNCLQTEYFTYNSLYHNFSGSDIYINEVDCAFKTSNGLGEVFQNLDEKRAQSKLPVTEAQKLGYA